MSVWWTTCTVLVLCTNLSGSDQELLLPWRESNTKENVALKRYIYIFLRYFCCLVSAGRQPHKEANSGWLPCCLGILCIILVSVLIALGVIRKYTKHFSHFIHWLMNYLSQSEDEEESFQNNQHRNVCKTLIRHDSWLHDVYFTTTCNNLLQLWHWWG